MLAEELKEALTISKVASLLNIPLPTGQGNQPCPFCQSSKSFKVYYDKNYKCFKCGARGDIFGLVQHSGLSSNFTESLKLVSSLVGNTAGCRQYKSRIKGVEGAFSIYQNNARKQKELVSEYCLSRGWSKTLKEQDFGFTNSASFLQDNGMDTDKLEELGLLWSKNKELYDNHLVFPIRNSSGSVVHLQGRNLGVNPERRWLADKGTPSITNYLYNLDKVKQSDYAVIVEGISDCRSLIEIEEPAVATFGINIPLVSHAKDFKHCSHLLAIFDRDKYPLGTPQAGQYKSWSQITPYLCELAIELRIPIFTWKVPNLPGVKDLNDLFLELDYDSEAYKELLKKTAVPLHRMALEVFSASSNKAHHSLLWGLHEAVDEPAELDRLESYVIKQHGNWRSYLKWMNS